MALSGLYLLVRLIEGRKISILLSAVKVYSISYNCLQLVPVRCECIDSLMIIQIEVSRFGFSLSYRYHGR